MSEKTFKQLTAQLRTLADDSERLNIYDCRNLATDSLRAIAYKLETAHKRELLQLDHGDCAKLRNCDVGTAEEQYRAHGKFCDAIRHGISGYHCDDAPHCVLCFSKWAQMPYKEGGAK